MRSASHSARKNNVLDTMSSQHLYDVTVLGAGVQGSSTAYYLTQKAGMNILLLEQMSQVWADNNCVKFVAIVCCWVIASQIHEINFKDVPLQVALWLKGEDVGGGYYDIHD